MMIAIIDYGAGNLFSIQSSLSYLGISAVVTREPDIIASAEHIIVPGVGAFGDAINLMRETAMDEVIARQAERGKPILGICLGMQLLFEGSMEHGEHRGLGLLPGWAVPLADVLHEEAKVPHMGWNTLTLCQPHPLLKHTQDSEYVYYVHSYYLNKGDCTLASTEYGGAVMSGMVGKDNVCGCQFHPEKSGDVGLRILKAFHEMR